MLPYQYRSREIKFPPLPKATKSSKKSSNVSQLNSLGDFVIEIALPRIVGYKPTEFMFKMQWLNVAQHGTSREAAQDDIH